MATTILNWAEGKMMIKQSTEAFRQTVVDVLFLLGRLRIAHWQASTKTNEHQALGGLYDAVGGLIDDFAEVMMGDSGDRSMPTVSGSIGGGDGFKGVVDELHTAAQTLCKAASPDLANIAADILQAANKARYLLS